MVIRITVLGGTQVTGGPDFRDRRHYLIDDDPNEKALPAIENLLGERKKGETRKMKIQLVEPSSGKLPLDHEAYTELIAWGRANGFEVSLP